MDNLTDSQVNLLKNGGNDKLNKFLKEQKIPIKTISQNKKYDNEAMKEYRKCLKENKDVSTIKFIGYKPSIYHKKQNSESIGFGNPNNDILASNSIKDERFCCCSCFF